MRRLLTELTKENSQVELERLLKIDQSTISAFLGGRQGTSFHNALAIAVAAGADPAEVLDLPRRAPGGKIDPYPSRATTLQWARSLPDEYSPRALEIVSGICLPNGAPDPGGRHWVGLLDAAKLGAIPPHSNNEAAPKQLTAGQRYPRDWSGFWPAADGILLNNPRKNTPYYGAVMWFSETLTAELPPVPLTTETLWKCILRFYDAHKDRRSSEMARWQAAGEDYHEQNKNRRKRLRVATESKGREKRSG